MKKRARHVRASDLAEMGFCEMKVLLKERHGVRDTAASAQAKRGGTTEHLRHHQAVSAHHNEAVRSPGSVRDKRCFIATAVYGADHPSTDQLRWFRDHTLLKSQAGRWAVRAYYLCSPPIASLIASAPWLARPVRLMLDIVRRRIAPLTCKDANDEHDESD